MSLETKEYEGEVGNPDHITCSQNGTVPTSAIKDLLGARGEKPGEHRNRQGDGWDLFLNDIRTHGIESPIFITVDHGQAPVINEGNHRRDAAVELGLPEVPVEIRYFGHAEQDSRVAALVSSTHDHSGSGADGSDGGERLPLLSSQGHARGRLAALSSSVHLTLAQVASLQVEAGLYRWDVPADGEYAEMHPGSYIYGDRNAALWYSKGCALDPRGLTIHAVEVEEPHRRRGLAMGLLDDMAERYAGHAVDPGGLTEQGRPLWHAWIAKHDFGRIEGVGNEYVAMVPKSKMTPGQRRMVASLQVESGRKVDLIHSTREGNVASILANGFRPGRGEGGYGVYFTLKGHTYAERGGEGFVDIEARFNPQKTLMMGSAPNDPGYQKYTEATYENSERPDLVLARQGYDSAEYHDPWGGVQFIVFNPSKIEIVSPKTASLQRIAFEVTATWADVRAKAKRIRESGGVRMVAAQDNVVTAHVQGDHGIYETQVVRNPGRKNIAYYNCGCKWASYAWGRSGKYKRFEGRLCSHALALQYEAQSRNMFGREMTLDEKQPAWMDQKHVHLPGDYRRDLKRYTSRSALDDGGFQQQVIDADLAVEASGLTWDIKGATKADRDRAQVMLQTWLGESSQRGWSIEWNAQMIGGAQAVTDWASQQIMVSGSSVNEVWLAHEVCHIKAGKAAGHGPGFVEAVRHWYPILLGPGAGKVWDEAFDAVTSISAESMIAASPEYDPDDDGDHLSPIAALLSTTATIDFRARVRGVIKNLVIDHSGVKDEHGNPVPAHEVLYPDWHPTIGLHPGDNRKVSAYGNSPGGTVYRGIRMAVPEGYLEAMPEYTEREQFSEHRSAKAGKILLDTIATTGNRHSSGMGVHWTERPEFASAAAATGGTGSRDEIRVVIEAIYTADDVEPEGSDAYSLTGVWMDSGSEAEVLIKPGARLSITGLWVPDNAVEHSVTYGDQCPKANWPGGPWFNLLPSPITKAASVTTASEDLTLYHGTTAKNVDAIKSQGLKPPPGAMRPAGWFMLTTSQAQAARYTSGQDDGVVLEYRVPSGMVYSRGNSDAVLWPGQEHTAYDFDATAYAVKDALPGKYLVAVHPVGAVIGAKKDEGPTVSGVVLKAADTGRVLMLQRSMDDDKASGKWEWPGGHHEDGDLTSLHAGIREWQEEVGQPFPEGGHVALTWISPNGVYAGHLVVIPSEKDLVLHEGRVMENPDDPDSEACEQTAWWDLDDARKNPALREEVKATTPWSKIKALGALSTTAGFGLWFHASPVRLQVGDALRSAPESRFPDAVPGKVYFTSDPWIAVKHVGGITKFYDGEAHLYLVDPIGEIEDDPEALKYGYFGAAYMADDAVVTRVYDLGSMEDILRAVDQPYLSRAAAVQHKHRHHYPCSHCFGFGFIGTTGCSHCGGSGCDEDAESAADADDTPSSGSAATTTASAPATYYHVSESSNRDSIEQHGLLAGEGGVWLYSDPERVRGLTKAWTPFHGFDVVDQDIWQVHPSKAIHGTQARDQWSRDEWGESDPVWVSYEDIPPSKISRVDAHTLVPLSTTSSLTKQAVSGKCPAASAPASTTTASSLSLENVISVAEEVMERGHQGGRMWDVPKPRLVDFPDGVWGADYKAAVREPTDFVNQVLSENGHPGGIRVYCSDYDMAGTQAVTDGMNYIQVKRTRVNSLTLLHECAHILNNTPEGGHTRAFVDLAARLYSRYISPAAGEKFLQVVNSVKTSSLTKQAVSGKCPAAGQDAGDSRRLRGGEGPCPTCGKRVTINWDGTVGYHRSTVQPEVDKRQQIDVAFGEHGIYPVYEGETEAEVLKRFEGQKIDIETIGSLVVTADEDQCPLCAGDSMPNGDGYDCMDCGFVWSMADPIAQRYHGDGPLNGVRGPATDAEAVALGLQDDVTEAREDLGLERLPASMNRQTPKEGSKMDTFGSLFDDAMASAPLRATASAPMTEADAWGLDVTVLADLHDEPEPALPSTDGEDNDAPPPPPRRPDYVRDATELARLLSARQPEPIRSTAADVICPKCGQPIAYGTDELVLKPGTGLEHKSCPSRTASQRPSAPVRESQQQKAARLLAYADAVARGETPQGPNPFEHIGAAEPDPELATAAATFLEKTALKTYDLAERNAIINEGEGSEARNLGSLDIRGTHYEAMDAQRSSAPDEDFDWLSGDPNDMGDGL